MRLSIAALLLVCATCTVVAFPRHHRRSHHAHAGVDSLRAHLATVRSKKAELRAEIRQTKKQTHQVIGDIRQVDARLSDVSDQLQDTSHRLTGARAEQRQIADQLAADTVRVAQLKEQVRKRLRAIYVRSNGSEMTALLSSRNLGELASRGYLMRTVARRDQEMFFQYRALKAQVAQQKARQDALVTQIGGLESREVSQERLLAETRQQKADMLDDLKQKQGELETSLAQFEADERDISAQIAAFARRAHSSPGSTRTLPAFTGRFTQPVNGRISDTFGMRYHPILHINRMHYGVDFAAPEGSPIHAAADGQVISTSYMRGYGNVVILDHGGGISTVYAHCSKVFCSPGQTVRRGEEIAAVGMTGLATGPHCHFEVRVNGHAVNPMGRL